MISCGSMGSAPQAPSPPALATAIESDGGEAPAIGPSKIGRRRPNRSQKAPARARAGCVGVVVICGIPPAHGWIGECYTEVRIIKSDLKRLQRSQMKISPLFRCRRRGDTDATQKGRERAGHIGITPMDEYRVHAPLPFRKRMYDEVVIACHRADEALGQQGHAQAGGDTSDNGLQGAEFEPARVENAALRQKILQAPAI